MTVTDITPLDLRGLTEDELAGLYNSGGTMAAEALAEAGRRDRDSRLARARHSLAGIRAEGDRQAYAQFIAASDSDLCKGRLLSREGMAAMDRGEIRDELDLWRIPADKALRYCSEELGLWWMHVSPRVTSEDYVKQHARERRMAAAGARDERVAGDGRDATARTGLAEPEAGALRRGTSASQAPQGRTGGTVQRGGRGAGTAEAAETGTADQRASGPVRGDTVSGCRHPHRVGTPGQCGNCPAKAVAVPVSGVVTSPGGIVARPEQLVPGDQLLDLIRDGYLGWFARFPSPAALDAVTLWAAHTHMRDESGVLVFRATPRLGLFSSEPGSGKGLVLELLMDIVPNCFGLDLEPTQAGLVHTINDEHATVLLDEADIMFGQGSRKEGVRAVLNGGTYRYGTILNGKGGKTNRVPVFGPVAVAGLDTMEKDTGDKLTAMWTRFVKVRMVKVTGADKPPKRTPKSYEAVATAKGWLELWASQVRDEVAAAVPEMPDEDMDGRTEDIWAPLLAVADAAGGSWPARARAACLELALARPGDSRDLAAEFEQFAGSFGFGG